MEFVEGSDVSHYHIISKLGHGGMATVYEAYDTHLDRKVAIKVIRREAVAPEMVRKMLKRFEREARTLAALEHPNIVKIYDYGEHDDSPYLVMEYIPGKTLKERTGTPLSYNDAACLLEPVARALAYAHRKNIIHRDVKPANILMSENKPMLSDFGIAKILDLEETHTLTGTGVGIGTPEYMSPEQGRGVAVDFRTDIYALGVVFFELVTGERPFQADTPMAVIIKHMIEPLPSPRKFVPGLPEFVEQVLFKALAKDPEARYPDMDSFTRALDSLTRTETIEIPLPVNVHPHQVGKYLLAGVGFLVVSLLIVLLWWFSKNNQTTVQVLADSAVSQITATVQLTEIPEPVFVAKESPALSVTSLPQKSVTPRKVETLPVSPTVFPTSEYIHNMQVVFQEDFIEYHEAVWNIWNNSTNTIANGVFRILGPSGSNLFRGLMRDDFALISFKYGENSRFSVRMEIDERTYAQLDFQNILAEGKMLPEKPYKMLINQESADHFSIKIIENGIKGYLISQQIPINGGPANQGLPWYLKLEITKGWFEMNRYQELKVKP